MQFLPLNAGQHLIMKILFSLQGGFSLHVSSMQAALNGRAQEGWPGFSPLGAALTCHKVL